MAGYAVVDADDDFGGDVARTGGKGAAGNGLEFQNFLSVDQPRDAASGRATPSRTDQTTTAPFSPFSITYYQHYFDLTTSQLRQRLLGSLIPRSEFLSTVCEGQVDLYGPFWTLTTLILSIYLSTSLSASISSALSPPPTPPPTKDGKKPTGQDFTLLSVAISLIYTYGLAFPALIWGAAKWFSRSGSGSGSGSGNLNDGLLGGSGGQGGQGEAGAGAEGGAGTDNKNLRLLTIIIVLVHCAVGLTMKVVFFSYSVGGKLIGPDDPLSGSVGGGLGGGNTDVDGVLDAL
ncbi:hypothetical protein QFC21_002529 [Naganishia friedmannii]|uniref:Uncharacterized protein n=1 Tax=Naganishia friedmannii TaxID=89922 RepID=A0ACC2VW41_9TREE|nr:hypothetical protein QFC21_002529 [Naganishia friedmannii]